MVMISMSGKARTPSDHSMGSPRYGGCVGAILHFFDWNPGKRFYSTKRLPAGKPDEGLRRSRSLRSDSGSAVRTLMLCDAQPQEDASIAIDEGSSSTVSHGTSEMNFVGDDAAAASSRAPSVVARLMGLESLPKGPYQPSSTARHRRSRSYSGAGEVPFGFMTRVDEAPVMLQELLQRDFKSSKKTLRDRMPEFAKRAQEQFAKNGVALKVVRHDEYMPTYIDIPDVQLSTSKQPFLQRLAPAATATPPASSYFELVSMDEGPVRPEKVSHDESSFRSERSSLLESECSSSRPASTKSSKPALANVARKIFQGRRRGTNWNGSEDSESSSSQVDTDLLLIRAPREHRKPRPAPARRDRTMRTTGANHHEASVQEFKSSGTRIPVIPKAALQSSRTSSSIAIDAENADDDCGQADQRLPLIRSRSRSTDFLPTVVEYSNSRTPASQESTTTVSQTSIMPLTSTVSASLSKAGRSGVKSARISKSDAAVSTVVPAKLASKAPPLDGYRAPKMMSGGMKSDLPTGSLSIPGYGKLLGADKIKSRKGGEIETGAQSTKNTLHGIQRVREAMLANAVPSVGDRLKRGERQDEMATSSNSAPIADDTNGVTLGGNRKNGMVSKHARALSIDDVFPELSLDCHAAAVPVCSDASKPPAVSMRVLSEQVYDVDLQEFFAAGPDDLRWEEEGKQQRVHSRELSGRFCERSCSGPSVSSGSGSVGASDVDDEEHNGDAWSSCASYDSADCDSPRTFELPDTDADECDLHEPKSSPMFVKKKKTGTGADEAAGQPSPVSILNSPFHDEAGTTSECTLNSDDEGVKSSTNSRTGEEATPTSPGDAHNDKIRQALLDISMFQSFTFDYKETCTPRETEQGFVREILSAAKLMGSPNWLDQDVAIDPCLMDRLQIGDVDRAEAMSSGMMWRCERRLLVDSVKEAFVATAWQQWRCAESMRGLQRWCWSRPRGQKLVAEVYKQIEEWRLVSALSLDFLIERDMELGDWKRFGAHAADVGMDIESMVWKTVVEDEMADLVAFMTLRR